MTQRLGLALYSRVLYRGVYVPIELIPLAKRHLYAGKVKRYQPKLPKPNGKKP